MEGQPVLSKEELSPSHPENTLPQVGRYQSIPLWVYSFCVGVILALGAGYGAVSLSREFYTVAPYHYDSASYRVQALQMYDLYAVHGRVAAILESLRAKDSLDLTIRLFIAPNMLLHRYGHLAVLIPLMSLYLALAFAYASKKTNSPLLAVAIVSFLFAFPFIYSPYNGIADFWKDNLATWLFGSAVICWLFAQTLSRPYWAIASSALLGLLVMQRSVAAVYAALIFLPLFLIAVWVRFKNDRFFQASTRVLSFVLPALILGLIVIVVQLNSLYEYYFVKGYSYGRPAQIIDYLINGATQGFGISIIVFGFLLVASLIFFIRRSYPRTDTLILGWIILIFPIAIISTSAFYFGFYAIWPPLLIVLLASVFPKIENSANQTILALCLIIIILISGFIQYNNEWSADRVVIASNASKRDLFDNVIILLNKYKTKNYSLLFDEVTDPFVNQAFFDKGIRFPRQKGFTSIHDSYYKVQFNTTDVSKIVAQNTKALESNNNTIAITYCNPSDISDAQYIDPLAKQFIMQQSDYLKNSLHWAVVRRFSSVYGCLYAYLYQEKELTDVKKWQALQYYQPLDQLPITIGLGTDVRLYNYESQNKAEALNGAYFQWLPAQKPGLRLTVYSQQPRAVQFVAHAVSGPARKDAARTLRLTCNSQYVSVAFSGAQDIVLPCSLQAGVNQLDIDVLEPADTPREKSSAPEQMVLLESPRLVPGGQ